MKKCTKKGTDGECNDKRGCEGCFYFKEAENERNNNNCDNMCNNNSNLYNRR